MEVLLVLLQQITKFVGRNGAQYIIDNVPAGSEVAIIEGKEVTLLEKIEEMVLRKLLKKQV